MSGRKRLWALLILGAVLLCGCTAAPPEALMRQDTPEQPPIDAVPQGQASDPVNAILYFRYGTTGYLAMEERPVSVEPNESPEKALVQALIAGPAATNSSLSPLFPPGTEVLAAVSRGDTLFITFNEALLGRYSDEPGDTPAAWKAEFALRRALCLDALAATLTEAGLCARVQVLVYRGTGQDTSMRLQAGFLDRSQDRTLLPPMTRKEQVLLTPHNTVSALMAAWMAQDWSGLYEWTAKDISSDRPGEQSAIDAFASARTLTSYSLSAGSVSPDGQSAIVGADLSFQGEGQDTLVTGYPVRLIREEGLWKISFAALLHMMNQD